MSSHTWFVRHCMIRAWLNLFARPYLLCSTLFGRLCGVSLSSVQPHRPSSPFAVAWADLVGAVVYLAIGGKGLCYSS
jgi:hypothetical protein